MTQLLTVEVDAIEVGSEDDFALILGSVLISGMGLLVECGEPEEGDEDLLAQSFLDCAVALSGSHDSGLIDIGRLFYCLGRRLAAEAASLVRTSAALLPAVKPMPFAPTPARGPPADALASTCEGGMFNVPQPEGGPLMAATKERAPRIAPRDSLSIVCPINKTLLTSPAMVAPPALIVCSASTVAADAVSLIPSGGRYVLAG
jgi:hypothetical protein